MDKIDRSKFYEALNELLGYIREIDDDTTMIENIELGHVEETTSGCELDDVVRKFAVSHYEEHRAKKMLMVLTICNELGFYDDIRNDGKCAGIDWQVNKK